MDEARQLRRRQRMNIIVARVIPVILTGIIAYASWVFVGPLCGITRPRTRAATSSSADCEQWTISSTLRQVPECPSASLSASPCP